MSPDKKPFDLISPCFDNLKCIWFDGQLDIWPVNGLQWFSGVSPMVLDDRSMFGVNKSKRWQTKFFRFRFWFPNKQTRSMTHTLFNLSIWAR